MYWIYIVIIDNMDKYISLEELTNIGTKYYNNNEFDKAILLYQIAVDRNQ
jgi:hypothetical protein